MKKKVKYAYIVFAYCHDKDSYKRKDIVISSRGDKAQDLLSFLEDCQQRYSDEVEWVSSVNEETKYKVNTGQIKEFYSILNNDEAYKFWKNFTKIKPCYFIDIKWKFEISKIQIR